MYMSMGTHKYTEASWYSIILVCRFYHCAVGKQITQSAHYGWESTIKRCSEKELSRDSLLLWDRSLDLTAREGWHIGQRLGNCLGWHSFAFPCKILPQGATSSHVIDVNRDKRTLISQYPPATSNLHCSLARHQGAVGKSWWEILMMSV